MRKSTYNLILFLLVGFSISLHASEPTFKKEITREVHKTFDVSPGVYLGVQNKHGNIDISTWNRNEIQIDVVIKVKSNNTEKAQQFLDEIEIAFESSSSEVKAQTIYPDQNNSGSWWSNWFNNGKNVDFEVHYTIQAPVQMSTKLINKYGNIRQASIDGASNVTNKYGDIFYENVSGKLTLDLGYGKATVGEAGDTKMQIKYSDIKIVETNDLDITTKYSEIQIKRCRDMVSQTKYDEYTIGTMRVFKNSGKYDDFNIGSVDEVYIDTKYTDLKMKTLNHIGVFETKYGGVNAVATGNNLEKISIQSKYTGYSFNIPGDFHLDFQGASSDLRVKQPYEKYISDKDGKDLRVKAYRGSKSSGTEIKVYMKYGGLDID